MVAKTRRLNRSAFWILIGLLLLGFALRVCRLDFFPLRGDESFTVLFVADPLPELIDGIRNVEPNPPLYYFLLRGLISLFGQSDFSARYVSAIFGLFAVPLIYQMGRVLFRRQRGLGVTVGLLAALLLAVNPYQIWHSQDVRNYTLWPALSLASLYLMLRALRDDRRLLWAGYIITTLFSLYTHYYHALILIFENTFVILFHHRNRPLLVRWFLSQAVLALLYFAWPLFASSRALTYPGDPGLVPGLHELLGQILSVFALGETISWSWAAMLLPVFILLSLLGLAFAFRQERRAFAFLFLFLMVPAVGLYILAQWRPLFRVRYLNAIAPAYYLCLALGLAALARLPRWGKAAAVAGLLVLLIPAALSLNHYYFDPTYAKSSDWRALAHYLEAQVAADEVIIQNDPDPTLAYYYGGSARRVVLPHRSAVDQVGNLPVKPVATGRALQELLAQHPRLWLIPHQSAWDPEGFVESWLERRARRVREEFVDVFRVAVYEAADTPDPQIQFPLTSTLGRGIEFLGYGVEARGDCKLEPGEAGGQRVEVSQPGSCALVLTLFWRSLEPVDADYTVFAHLVDSRGAILAQQDNRPQSGGFSTLEWLPGDLIPDEYVLSLPAGAQAGAYELEVGMYRLETLLRPATYDQDGERWPDDAIRLNLAVEVTP